MVASSKFGLLIIKWHRANRNTYIIILRVTGQTWESQYSSYLIVINHLTGCLVYANKVTPHVSLQSSLTYFWEYPQAQIVFILYSEYAYLGPVKHL